jgi:hypothetical protein
MLNGKGKGAWGGGWCENDVPKLPRHGLIPVTALRSRTVGANVIGRAARTPDRQFIHDFSATAVKELFGDIGKTVVRLTPGFRTIGVGYVWGWLFM